MRFNIPLLIMTIIILIGGFYFKTGLLVFAPFTFILSIILSEDAKNEKTKEEKE